MIQPNLYKKVDYVLYILTSVWVLRTPNAGRNGHFQHFFCKKAQKSKKFAANFCKKHFFKFASERWSTVILRSRSKEESEKRKKILARHLDK